MNTCLGPTPRLGSGGVHPHGLGAPPNTPLKVETTLTLELENLAEPGLADRLVPPVWSGSARLGMVLGEIWAPIRAGGRFRTLTRPT